MILMNSKTKGSLLIAASMSILALMWSFNMAQIEFDTKILAFSVIMWVIATAIFYYPIRLAASHLKTKK